MCESMFNAWNLATILYTIVRTEMGWGEWDYLEKQGL